ncbi:MAG: ABC transporter substrate-binding protein [Desulfobacula sp.]|nr:ABC transporter substrate-binding protein [Desulfobacula sp.]
MKGQPQFKIGHLKIIDHLILGVVDHLLNKKDAVLEQSTFKSFAFNSWNQLCDQLTQGNINGAFITIPTAMDLFAKGLDIKLLMFTHRGGGIIVKKNISTITCIKDFKNHTVLVPSELCVQTMLLHRLLSSAGLKFGTHNDENAQVVRETANPYLMPQMLANDTDNDIAGFAVAEPYGSQAILQDTATRVCYTGKLWKNHPCCAFIMSTRFIEQYPDAVKEIIILFVQAAQKIEMQKDESLFSIARHFLNQKQNVIQQVLLKSDICFDPDLLTPDLDAIETIHNYMSDTMNIMTEKIDIARFVETAFTSNKTLGHSLENRN